jgi:hypothetical protein
MAETAHDLSAIFDDHVADEFVAKDVARPSFRCVGPSAPIASSTR